MRNVLVTGSTGLIGSNLIKALSKFPDKIRIIGVSRSKLSEHDEKEVCRPFKNGYYQTYQGDITDYSFIESVINKHECDTVFHLAANAIVRTAQKSPLHCFDINIKGTWNVLEACRQNNVGSVVCMASDKYYGQTKELPYKEDMTPVPGSPYEVSKTCADFLCSSYYKTYGLPVATVRGANVFGPGDLNLSRLIPNSCTQLLNGKPPIIWEDVSEYEREFIYVDDMCYALIELALRIDVTKGEAFNVGSGKTFKVKDLVKRLCKVSGNKNIQPEFPKKSVPFLEIPKQVLCIDKIKKYTSWEARRTDKYFDVCLASTYNWYARYYGLNRKKHKEKGND